MESEADLNVGLLKCSKDDGYNKRKRCGVNGG